MKYCFYALAVLAMLNVGCKGGKDDKTAQTEVPEEEPLPERFENDDLPKAADELFDDFMYYFASNEELQRRRIVFPLPVDTGVVEEEKWQMDPFFTKAGEYTLIFDSSEQREVVGDTAISTAVVEKIFLSNDSISQYHFIREDGRWRLTAIAQQPLNKNANADFLKFYYSFANDSAFQQQSLNDEIEFTGPDPEDDFAMMEGFITPGSWEAFAPELPNDTIYNIVYGKQNTRAKEKVFVICGIANGQEIELNFRKQRGQWKLTKLTE